MSLFFFAFLLVKYVVCFARVFPRKFVVSTAIFFFNQGIDGFGGVHFRNVTQNYSTLRSFIDQGAYTTQARGVYPIVS